MSTVGVYEGEIYTSSEPDWSIFSTSELAALALVKNTFQGFSARQIREFSHKETAYKNTANGKQISYLYAKDLQI